MPRRKQEKTVNLVRKKSSDAYRVVPDHEMIAIRDKVYFESAKVQGNMYGYFYVEM